MLTEFWNWYLSLFSDPDNKVRLTVWTATLATVTFTLTFVLRPLWKWIRRKRGLIIVKAGVSHQIMQSPLASAVGAPLLTCIVTNRDDKHVFIQNPSIRLSQKVNGEDTFGVPRQRATFPMKLDPGQQYSVEYNSVDLHDQLLARLSDNATLHFIVTTTTGKKYESEKVKKKDIVGHINVAVSLNQQ